MNKLEKPLPFWTMEVELDPEPVAEVRR